MCKKFVLILYLLVASISMCSAQSADKIVENYVKARGGMEKINSIKTIKLNGKLSTNGMELNSITYYKFPNKFKTATEIQGKTIIQAFDGVKGWMINPLMGSNDPLPMPTPILNQLKQMMDFWGPLVDYKKKGNKVELVGKEKYKNGQLYNLKITKNTGDAFNYYLDTKTFKEIKVYIKKEIQGVNQEITSYFSNHKTVDGILVAFDTDVQSKGVSVSKISVQSLEFNTNINDNIFKSPIKSEKTKK